MEKNLNNILSGGILKDSQIKEKIYEKIIEEI